MEIQEKSGFSAFLNRQMRYGVYGSSGKPVLFFPCQGGSYRDFAGFHMSDVWEPWISSGQCTVFTADSIDSESWASPHWDKHRRMEIHERWVRYIVEELVPNIREITGCREILTCGCSLGAMHAANLYYRFPNVFGGCFALSGVYDHTYFMGDYCDDLVYRSCPCLYLKNLPADHPYRRLYARQKSLIVCGQGAWEEDVLRSTRWLDEVCRENGIPTRFFYWGQDVSHDWCWWYKMVQTYLPAFLKD